MDDLAVAIQPYNTLQHFKRTADLTADLSLPSVFLGIDTYQHEHLATWAFQCPPISGQGARMEN